MAAKLEPLNLRITGSANGLSAALGRAQGDVGQFSSNVEQQASKISGALSSIAAFAVPAGLTAALGFGVKLAADAQDAELSFKALTGSAEAAQQVLAELNAFSASTPFSFADDVRPAAQQLLTYGFTVDELQDQLRILGNVAAVSGTDFAELAKLIGRARSTNLIFTEDLNQLSDRAIPVLDLLAERFGVTTARVRELSADGQIQFADLAAVLEYLGGEGGKFGDALQERSEALNGAFSTLTDNVSLLATGIGSALVPATTDAVHWATQWVQYLREMDPATVEVAAKTGAFTVALAGTALVLPKLITLGTQLVTAIRAIAAASTLAQALSGPKGWASIAAGLAVAGGAVYAVDQLFDSLNETQAQTVAVGGDVADTAAEIAKRSIDAGDAAGEAAKAQERWLKVAADFRKSLETPIERYQRQIEDLSAAVREGGLEWEFFERGVAKAISELDSAAQKTEQLKRPDALLAGSEGAEEAIFKFRQHAVADDDTEQRVAAEVESLRAGIEQQAKQAAELKAKLAESAEAAANANVDRLVDGLEQAKAKLRELTKESTGLSNFSYDQDGLIGKLNSLRPKLLTLAGGVFTGNIDGVYQDQEKVSRFDQAQAATDKALEQALRAEEQLSRAQAEAEAARQAAADSRRELQLQEQTVATNNLAEAIRNRTEPQPLSL